jgi:hypothetical protein
VTSEFYGDEIFFGSEEAGCCFCLNKHCNNDCYEYYQGICGRPEVFTNDLISKEIKTGSTVATEIIKDDPFWNLSYRGVVKEIGDDGWITVQFDTITDPLKVDKDMLYIVV